MSKVAVTYNGPGSAYHGADEDGIWHEFVPGATLTVPEDFAETLLEVEGHDFELANEVDVVSDQDGETDEDADGEDTEGVNAADTYLEE